MSKFGVVVAGASLLVIAGCDDFNSRGVGNPEREGAGQGPGGADFSQVASYLAGNANFPAPSGDDESPEAPADTDGGDDSGNGDDNGNASGDDGNASGGGTGGNEPPADPSPEPCNGFECNDGQCIDSSWKCDDYVDCTGGEDEAGCPQGGTSAGSGGGSAGDPQTCDGFECDDGLCIDESWACDDIEDCAGGEDEAGCSIGERPGPGLDTTLGATPRGPSMVSQSCLATWTQNGAIAGTVAGEALSKACTGGGVVAGFLTAGGGFAAATVCAVGDGLQVDALAGGIFGALSGLTGGLVFCEGGAMDLATQALHSLTQSQGIPNYKVESQTATCPPCAIPAGVPEPDRVDCVPPSAPHFPCKSHHWHVYRWEVNQNPQTCECHNNKREEVLCYDPVGDPQTANDPLWNVCGP